MQNARGREIDEDPATPAASTQPPTTPGGSDSRPIAAQMIQRAEQHEHERVRQAASTSARRQPKLRSGVAGRNASQAAKRASPSATRPRAMCAASARSASESATIPTTASTPANAATSASAIARARSLHRGNAPRHRNAPQFTTCLWSAPWQG